MLRKKATTKFNCPKSFCPGLYLKATLYPKFWRTVKELKKVFELEEFWGRSPNRPSRPCESATLVRGRFGGLLSNINSKINFQTSLKFPQTQISLKNNIYKIYLLPQMSSKNFQNIQEASFSFTLWCDYRFSYISK